MRNNICTTLVLAKETWLGLRKGAHWSAALAENAELPVVLQHGKGWIGSAPGKAMNNSIQKMDQAPHLAAALDRSGVFLGKSCFLAAFQSLAVCVGLTETFDFVPSIAMGRDSPLFQGLSCSRLSCPTVHGDSSITPAEIPGASCPSFRP